MRSIAVLLLLAMLVVPASSAAPPDDVDELGETVAECATMLTRPSENPADVVFAAAGFAICVATS